MRFQIISTKFSTQKFESLAVLSLNLIMTLNSYIKIFAILVLFFQLSGCGNKENNQQVNELVREGNNLLNQESEISNDWKTEFMQFFNPKSRADFPSNRELLRPHAENQIRFLKRMSELENNAAEKFEKASQVSTNEKEKKAISLLAASFRKNIEINQVFEKQMELVLDENIKDSQTFESKFTEITRNIETMTAERDRLQNEAKSIIGKKPE